MALRAQNEKEAKQYGRIASAEKKFNVASKPFPHLFVLMPGDASKIKPQLK